MRPLISAIARICLGTAIVTGESGCRAAAPDLTATPALAGEGDELLFALCPDAGRVLAVEPRSGRARWSAPLGPPVSRDPAGWSVEERALLRAGERVVVRHGGDIVALHARDGRMLWRRSEPCLLLAANREHVLVSCLDLVRDQQALHLLDARDGRRVRSFTLGLDESMELGPGHLLVHTGEGLARRIDLAGPVE
jgi:outer membrane protein assembly factor BamB